MTTRTLWVKASPKTDQSLSSSLAQQFLDGAGPDVVGDVSPLDLWSDDFPVFDRDTAIAKFAPLFGEKITTDQKAKWQSVVDEIERVRAFDRVVISSPMWNWSVPYPLKAWIDVLVQPLLSFTLDAEGRHIGTLGDGKPLHLILTRSSAYDGRHLDLEDHQLPYLTYVFSMLGYTVTPAFIAEPTTHWDPADREKFKQKALQAAWDAGAELCAG